MVDVCIEGLREMFLSVYSQWNHIVGSREHDKTS